MCIGDWSLLVVYRIRAEILSYDVRLLLSGMTCVIVHRFQMSVKIHVLAIGAAIHFLVSSQSLVPVFIPVRELQQKTSVFNHGGRK